jgi:hypothetical protein
MLELLSLGSLDTLTVTKIVADHPGRTGSAGGSGVGWGEYFTLTPNAGANGTFNAILTLPALFPPDAGDTVCRYLSGTAWDCAADSFTITPIYAISRQGVSAFSDWAAGDDVSPTALQLTSLRAVPAAGSAWLPILVAVLLAGSAAFAWRGRLVGWLLR